MATKRVKRNNRSSYITYDDLEALSFGSWLKKNAGTIGTVVGGTIGTFIAPGVGTALGTSIGSSIGGAVSTNEADKEATEAQNKLVAQQNAQASAQAELARLQNNSPVKTFAPVMANGGEIKNIVSSGEPEKITVRNSKKGTSIIPVSGLQPDTVSGESKSYKGDKIKVYKNKKTNGTYVWYGDGEPSNNNDLELIDEINDPNIKFYSPNSGKLPLGTPEIADPAYIYDAIYGKQIRYNKAMKDLENNFKNTFPEVASIVQQVYDESKGDKEKFFNTLDTYAKTYPELFNKSVFDSNEVRNHFITNNLTDNDVARLSKNEYVKGSNEDINKSLYDFGVRTYGNTLFGYNLPSGEVTLESGYIQDQGGAKKYDQKINISSPAESDNKVSFKYEITKPKGNTPQVEKPALSGEYTYEMPYTPYTPKNIPYINEYKSLQSNLNKFTGGKPITINDVQYIQKAIMTKSKAYGGLINNLPLYNNGGTINYDGQTHEGPDGGIPVDEMGNPTQVSANKPVASVEKGEVAFTLPNNEGTYVFSNRLKYDSKKTFADKAKEIQRKYKLRLKDGKITDPISEVGYNKEMIKLIEAQEAFREVSGVNKEARIKEEFAAAGMPIENNTLPIGENGIYIKPSRRGTFTAAAKKHGMGTQEFARHVLANKEDYSSSMVKKANFARNMARSNKKGGFDISQFLSNTGESLKQSTIGVGEAALPAIAATIGNSILANKIRDRKIDQLHTDPIVAQQISLANERNAAIEQARALEAQNRRNALLTGSSAGQINQNNITGALGIQRGLGDILSKSYSTEAQTNAQYAQQAAIANAEKKLQEQQFNTQMKLQRDALLDQLRSATANAWAQAASTYLQGKRDFQTLNMKSPDYSITASGNIFFPTRTKTVKKYSNNSSSESSSGSSNGYYRGYFDHYGDPNYLNYSDYLNYSNYLDYPSDDNE